MTAELAAILLPVFALATIGYGWHRLALPFDREFVTRITLNVSGPCLIVDSLSKLDAPGSEFLLMLGASIAMFVATIAAGAVIIRLAKMPMRSFLPALAIGNTGNMGLPLCLFAFGQEGLGFAVAVYVTNSVGQFTLTPMLQSGTSPLKTLATSPVVYGAAFGAAILAGDVTLPVWIAATIEILGGLLIPLMLIALGHTLGALYAKRLPFALGWGAARLVLGFSVAWAVATLTGLDGVAKGVLILQGTMPAAIFNYLFSARYGRHPDDVAGIVLMSTLLSALTLPLLMAYVLSLAG
jgi:hypothetical protein